MRKSDDETVAEILREMRIFKCRNLATGELEDCGTTQTYFADRIEAAHKREVAELRDALKDAIGLFCATCTDREEDSGRCKDKDGVCPPVARWLKALEGTTDETK